MKRIAVAAVSWVVLVLLSATGAWASWSKPGTDNGKAIAATVKKPTAPSVSKSGTTASISWTATTLDDNTTAATGYAMLRHVGATTTTICTTAASTVSCSDASPVAGTATYGVVAKFRTGRARRATPRRSRSTGPPQ